MLAQRWLDPHPVSLDDLYRKDPSSRYWYVGGFNLSAIVTTVIVSAFVMTWHLEISWIVGMPASLVVYWVVDRLHRLLHQRSAS
jgi:cytosine/uracil/thiamine/allantoin permease